MGVIAFFFFFFFFFNDIYKYPLIRQSFSMAVGKHLNDYGYIDMSYYISGPNKSEVIRTLGANDFSAKKLYDEPFPKSEDTVEDEILSILDEKDLERETISIKEAKAITYWIFKAYSTIDDRQKSVQDFLQQWIAKENESKSSTPLVFVKDSIGYLKSKVDVHLLTSVSQLYPHVVGNVSKDVLMFFRGHSNANYLLLPSLMRNVSWCKNEHRMYHEVVIDSWKTFSHLSNPTDYLIEMQHYGLPTRLLDITTSPLVALYFACAGSPDTAGEVVILQESQDEIKYPNSDTVSILSALPLLSNTTQLEIKAVAEKLVEEKPEKAVKEFNNNQYVQLLLHEIKSYNPAFRNKIDPNDILDCFLILSIKKNERIIQQHGSFMIFGLVDSSLAAEKLRYRLAGKPQIFIVPRHAKKNILKELDYYKINEAILFPEINNVANHTKKKFFKE